MSSQVVETNDIKIIKQHLKLANVSSLILVDIDDTVITPKSNLFHAKSRHRNFIDDIKKNHHEFSNFETIISSWRLKIKVRLVSDQWPRLIKDCLSKGAKIFALTQMDSGNIGSIKNMEEWRYGELKDMDIVFSDSLNNCNNFVLIEDEENESHAKSPAVFYKGIIVTGSSSKGKVVQKILENNCSEVIFIDDRMSHIEDVKNICVKNNIAYKGILYSGIELMEGEEPIDEIADFQKETLIKNAKWYEDDEAANMIKELGQYQ